MFKYNVAKAQPDNCFYLKCSKKITKWFCPLPWKWERRNEKETCPRDFE